VQLPDTQTFYIVPAWSDIAGQCRIVARDYFRGEARDNYRKEPEKWREVGLMSSQGKLVCFDGSLHARQEITDCEPLMAGLVFEVAFTAATPSTPHVASRTVVPGDNGEPLTYPAWHQELEKQLTDRKLAPDLTEPRFKHYFDCGYTPYSAAYAESLRREPAASTWEPL